MGNSKSRCAIVQPGTTERYKHIEAYEHYCEHCDVLLSSRPGAMGFKYNIDLATCKEARCKLTVERKPQT